MTTLPPAATISMRIETIASWLAVAIAFTLPLSTSATDVLFIAAPLLFWCTGRWREKWAAIWQRRAVFAMLLLFLLMLVGVSYSSTSMGQAVSMLLKNDKYIWGVLFLPLLLHEKWRYYAIHAFFAAIVVTLIVAVLIKAGSIQNNKYSSVMLFFKDSIQTSFLMAISAYFAAVYYLYPLKDTTRRWPYAILALVCTVFLFSIGGRSGYFVFFVLALLLCWNHWRWRGLIYGALFFVIVVAAAYSFSSVFRVRMADAGENVQAYQQMGDSTTSVGQRMQFAKNSWELVKQHPLFGTGTGSLRDEYAPLVHQDPQQMIRNPHNEYLNFLVQWGVVGLALLLFVFYLQGRDSYLLPPPMQQIIQGTLVAVLVGCLANSWLMDTTEGHFYTYFVALAFASQLQLKPLLSGKNLK